jgi:parallel beta-helix repeat protein
MNKKVYLNLVFLAIAVSVYSQKKIVSITDFGAKPDGITSNTVAIQNAIDKVNENGGGVVLVPDGKFLTGVIHLKSNVEFHLADRALLLGSAKRIDYGPKDASALIVATNQQNVSITGKGEINGQGDELIKDIYVMLNAGTLEDKEWKTYNPWHQMRPEERNRPKIIYFVHCDNIQLKGITLKNGLCWVQDFTECSNILIDSINVESNTFWNNDGIDLVDCKNARITHCFINSDDDGICLKSSNRNSFCENIIIANCTVRSSASAVKLGTASWGGFKKITVRDIKVYDTYRSAIAIESVDGGVLEDIDVRNIEAKNTGNAILIRLGHRNKDSVYSTLSRVYIGNIRVEVPKTKTDKGYPMEGPLLNFPHNIFPSSITGIPGHPVKDVTIENIEIVYGGGADKKVAYFSIDTLNRIPERVPNYPEFSMFGELPAWGFYVRHVEGLQMKNIRLSYKEDDFRQACIFDDVKNLLINGLNIPSAKEYPVILMNKVTGQKLENVQLPVDNQKGILIQNN